MATTASGVTIPGSSPTTTAATPIQDHWNNLGKSLDGKLIPTVASVTARAALVAALTADGYTITPATPLYVHRTDAPVPFALEVTTNGTTWRAVNGAPFAECVVSATSAADGSFSGTFPAGTFTVAPVLQCTVQTGTQYAFAGAVASSATAFSGFCAFFSSGALAMTAGFTISIRAVQMTATTAVS